MEVLKLLPEGQGGFKNGRGTIDNIFVLKHLSQRMKKKKDKKIYVMFVDLKAAFDRQGQDCGDYWRKRRLIKVDKKNKGNI